MLVLSGTFYDVLRVFQILKTVLKAVSVQTEQPDFEFSLNDMHVM